MVASAALTGQAGSSHRAARACLLAGWRALERMLDGVLGPRGNPLRHLGALGCFAFWLLAASGAVLYVVLDTSVAGAYRSIAGLDAWPLGAGRLLRGVHRYAADLLVVVMGLHLIREWLHGHERGVRRFPWLTGVPLIGFAFLLAVGGFWINWDALGQFSALATAEWLDALPRFFATPLARNFLVADQVSDRLFSLLIFVHLGIGLLMLFGLWFHLQRLTRAAVWPPRPLAVAAALALAGLALGLPVQSHAPASLGSVPAEVRLDWLLLFVHPLMYATSAEVVWAGVAATTVLLFVLPFLPQAARAPVAVVDAANCNGCRRCLADCPYAAVTMVPHADPDKQRMGRTLAVIDADLCTGCGICAGACPSSTPFRSQRELDSGIDLPQLTVGALRQRLAGALAARMAARPLVVFGCAEGVRLTALRAADDVVVIELVCAGQLPPSFIEYALRDGAAGVLVVACREAGCEYRHGERITAERLDGQREPHLRAQVERARVALVFAGRGDEAEVAAAVARMRVQVVALKEGQA